MEKEPVILCVDGSHAQKQPHRPLGIAWVVAVGKDDIREISFASALYRFTPENRNHGSEVAEVLAATLALDHMEPGSDISLYSDNGKVLWALRSGAIPESTRTMGIAHLYEGMLSAASRHPALKLLKATRGGEKSYLLGMAHHFAYRAATGKEIPIFLPAGAKITQLRFE